MRLPSTSTVQAPHWPWSQPFLVPVRSRSWRSRSSSVVQGATDTVRGAPLIVSVIDRRRLGWHGIVGHVARPHGGQCALNEGHLSRFARRRAAPRINAMVTGFVPTCGGGLRDDRDRIAFDRAGRQQMALQRRLQMQHLLPGFRDDHLRDKAPVTGPVVALEAQQARWRSRARIFACASSACARSEVMCSRKMTSIRSGWPARTASRPGFGVPRPCR